jgi:hypothetical protein
MKKDGKKVKIDIGGGYKKEDGFLVLDIDPNTNPDYVIDLEKDKLPFDDNTVDEVRAWHVLEHLGAGYFHCLQELYRVCKDGAIIDIRVPHHFHEVFINDPTHQRPITVEGMRLFSKKNNENEIKTGGTSSCLGIRFNVDFEVIFSDYVHDGFYDGLLENMRNKNKEGTLTQEDELMVTRLFREANNTTIETLIKLMVIKNATT